jgi:hypothetical protein
VLSLRHSLHRKPSEAGAFYAIYGGLVAAAAALVLLPGAPLGLITEGVQTLAGVLLPSATVFLLLLCNDRDVLGPWVNGPWLNLFTGVVIAVLVILSVVLTASVAFPDLSGRQILWILGVGAAVATAVGGVALWSRRGTTASARPEGDRASWSMPPLHRLPRYRLSGGARTWMLVLRVYLVGACALVVLRVVQLATGHG